MIRRGWRPLLFIGAALGCTAGRSVPGVWDAGPKAPLDATGTSPLDTTGTDRPDDRPDAAGTDLPDLPRTDLPDASPGVDVSPAPLGRLVEIGAAIAAAVPPLSGGMGLYYGAVAEDVNADGRPDVLAWSDRGWVLFEQSADGRFSPLLHADTGLRCAGFGDLDGDGAPDAVLALRTPLFLHNEGGALVDRTTTALGGEFFQGEFYGVTFADIDSDGLLDVAFAQMNCGSGPSYVFRNEGDFHFVNVAPTLGLDLSDGAAFALAIDAVDDDGVLHVWSFPEGCVMRRMQHWRFRGGDDLPGLVDVRGTDADWANPMGSALLDVDGDGRLDLYLSSGSRNAVLAAPELVTSLADAHGLVEHPSTFENPASAWSAVLLDADLDGAPDLYVTHSPARPEQSPFSLTDALYLHGADGRYGDIAARVGIDHDHDCQAAFGVDLDHDGDTDLLTGCHDSLRVLRNDLVADPPGRTLRLRGTVSNADGVHAIVVGPGGERRVQRGGGQPYAGGVGRESLRAAGGRVTVLWPSGIHQTVDAGPSPALTITEPAAVLVSPRRVAVGAQTPVRVVVDPAALGTPAAPVRVETTGGRWSEPLAMGADGRWQGTLVPPAERSTTALTVTLGALTLRVRPKVFVR